MYFCALLHKLAYEQNDNVDFAGRIVWKPLVGADGKPVLDADGKE